eukprot:Sdes_comp13671_c0_seq1m3262
MKYASVWRNSPWKNPLTKNLPPIHKISPTPRICPPRQRPPDCTNLYLTLSTISPSFNSHFDCHLFCVAIMIHPRLILSSNQNWIPSGNGQTNHPKGVGSECIVENCRLVFFSPSILQRGRMFSQQSF